jgi:hypothetical protein
MKKQSFKKIWRAPFYLGAITMLGLLSALLGTGFWYPIAWVAMTLPLAVIIYQIYRHQKSLFKKSCLPASTAIFGMRA